MARIPSGEPLWRSIVLRAPMRDANDNYNRPVVHKALKQLAAQLGIKGRYRTTLQLRVQSGFWGYLRIYRGANPTPAEKALFRRALRLASALPGVAVEENP